MNRLTRWLSMTLMALILITFPSGMFAQDGEVERALSGELDMQLYYDDIRGNEDLSFKEQGTNYLSDIYFYYNDRYGNENPVELDGQLYVRGTNDERYQTSTDKVRVENVFLTAKKADHWSMTGGYFQERFSDLSMNTVQLGSKASYHLTDTLRIKAFGGRDRRASNDQYRRISSGAQLRWGSDDTARGFAYYLGQLLDRPPATERSIWDFNYVSTRDIQSSADITADAEENVVRSISHERRFEDSRGRVFLFDGEYAQSDRTTRVQGSSDTEIDAKEAIRANIRYRPGEQVRFRYRFERTDQQFQSLTASVRENRILHRGQFNYDIREFGLDRWRFHLLGQRDLDEATEGENKDRRTVRSGLNYRGGPESWFQDLSLETERRWRTDEQDTQDQRIHDVETMLNLGWSELLLSSTVEDNKDSKDRMNNYRTMLYIDGTLMGMPMNYEGGVEYRKDRRTTSSDTVYHNYRNVIEQYLTIGRGRERLNFEYRYDYDRPGNGQGNVVQQEVLSSFDYTMFPDKDGVLSLQVEWFDNEDKADSSQNYSEYTYKLQFRSQF